MHNRILGTLIMLWGVGILIGVVETVLFKNSDMARMLFTSAIQLSIAVIPIIVGLKIFRKKNYSRGNYLFWIILILVINIVAYVTYKPKINQKIALFKIALPFKIKQATTPKIIKATIKNDVNEIKRLVAKGVDVDENDGDGRTAIFYARNIKIMKLLLDAGADVNVLSKSGHTLLNSKTGSTHIQSYEATQLLLEHGLTKETINSQEGYLKYHALHRSDLCFFCDESKEYTDGSKNVELLIRNGANLNAVNKEGETPIFTVNDKCKRIFIDNGADIFTLNNNNENVLFYVNDYDLFTELVSKGLDHKQINKKGETILHYTSSAKIADFVAKKVDINHRNHEGRTALFWCYYNPNKIKSLLRNNADVNIVNNRGQTALHQYVKSCRSDKGVNKELLIVIELLLNTDIDLDYKDNQGKTALDYARIDKVKNLLLAKGAQNSIE